MLKKLGIIKKIQLWIKGRNDAKSERFQEVVVTVRQQEEKMILPTNIEETVLEKKEQFMMKWQNKPNVDVNINLIWEEMNQYVENLLSEVTSQKFLVSKQKKIHISAFMLTELQEFKRERDYLISHKKFKIHKQESAPKKSFTFQKGINFLEKNLKDLNAQMFIKETEYKKRKEWLETELNKCKNGLISAHQLKEYEAEMEEVNRLYLKEQEQSYMNAIFLIHEEIKIIEQMKVLLRLKKNYHFQQKQTYL